MPTITGLNPDCALKNNFIYYAIVERPGYIQLADSFANAIAGNELEFDISKTTGDAHYFVVVSSRRQRAAEDGHRRLLRHDDQQRHDDRRRHGQRRARPPVGTLDIVAETVPRPAPRPSAARWRHRDLAVGRPEPLDRHDQRTPRHRATLVVPGEVNLEATQHTATETVGRGDVDAETAGIALALALAIVEDEVTANVARSLTADAVSLTASGVRPPTRA